MEPRVTDDLDAPHDGQGFNPLAERALPLPRTAVDDELLNDGQEEVFSRAEVEAGLGEHGANT